MCSFYTRHQKMAQSHDSMVASIVSGYVQPQQIYLLISKRIIQMGSPFMGYLESLMKMLYEGIIDYAKYLHKYMDDDEKNDPVIQKIITFALNNNDATRLTGNEWKLIIAEALEIGIISYGDWDDNGYLIFKSNYETGTSEELSLAEVVELLRR